MIGMNLMEEIWDSITADAKPTDLQVAAGTDRRARAAHEANPTGSVMGGSEGDQSEMRQLN